MRTTSRKKNGTGVNPLSECQAVLVDWFKAHGRSLPWRAHPTPYGVMVSEFMLQQTQIATVLPYYARFMEVFPSVESLAQADEAQVLKLWEGLGYYSRARRLRECARTVVQAGRFPDTAEALQRLPGVGPYTAAAIASIAFGKASPVVDGNVLRVCTRLCADGSSTDGPASRKRYASLLQPVIEQAESPSLFNQSMMELGEVVCRPVHPQCESCPARGACRARLAGNAEDYPRKLPKAVLPHYHVAVALVYDGPEFLILKRNQEQMLGGLWEFPGGKLEPGETAEQAAVRETLEETGLQVAVMRELCVVRHAYSHFRITMHAFQCSLVGEERSVACDRPYHWITPERVDEFTFPKANHKIFQALKIVKSRK